VEGRTIPLIIKLLKIHFRFVQLVAKETATVKIKLTHFYNVFSV
jgi:hypothetical protein